MFPTLIALCAFLAADGPQYNPAGQLLLPAEYRQWIYLSSGLDMTYGPAREANPNASLFDNVFVNPAAHKAFLETGRWPDKTIFILEVRRAAGKGSINNAGHYQTEIAAIEAAVKDESRYPQKWAYFNLGRSDKAEAFPATSVCNNCHGTNAAVENTFVQFYPTLLEIAQKKRTLNPAYLKKEAAGGGAIAPPAHFAAR
jgi:hypothetical protein